MVCASMELSCANACRGLRGLSTMHIIILYCYTTYSAVSFYRLDASFPAPPGSRPWKFSLMFQPDKQGDVWLGPVFALVCVSAEAEEEGKWALVLSCMASYN